MFKCCFVSIPPTKMRKLTSGYPSKIAELQTSLKAASAGGQPTIPVLYAIQEQFLHFYSHGGEARCLRRSREVTGLSSFSTAHTVGPRHRTRRTLLTERKRLHYHCLLGARHQSSSLKTTIQLSVSQAPERSHSGMPGSLLLLV